MAIRGRLLIIFLLGQASFITAADAPAKSYVIQTVAGSDSTGDGGSALAAQFGQTEGIAVDAAGAIYIADADDNRVRKISADGRIQTVTGTGVAGFSGDGGPAVQALLSHPYGLAVDAAGNLFIADLGNARVRKVSTDGKIQTVAGGGSIVPGGNGDGGPAVLAQLLQPRNVAVDRDGTFYISDFGANRIYQISPAGIITTLAGTGNAGFSGDGSVALLAQLKSPAGLATDLNGALYIADTGNNRIRKVFRGVITTVYNTTGPTGVAIGPSGALYIASTNYFGTSTKAIAGVAPARDVAVDSAGNLYATTGQFVRKVTSAGVVTTVAGSAAPRYFGGDNGPANAGRLHAPAGVAIDDAGNFYIADTANNRVRKVTAAGIISTIAGTGDLAQLNGPRSVAVDQFHNVYVADSGNNAIRKITPDGFISTLATQLNDPEYITSASDGSLYVADTGNNRVLKLTATGVLSTVTQIVGPIGLALDLSGNLFVVSGKRITEITPDGIATVLIDGLFSPRGIGVNGDGDLFIAESGVNVIRRLTPSGVLSIIAGTGQAGFSGDGALAGPAQLNAPQDLAIDAQGNILVADSGNNRVRALTPSAIADVTLGAAIVHAATLAPGPIAPGEIVTIFGSGFIPDQTQLYFDGTPAAIFYSGTSQINALAPSDLTPNALTEIGIVANGVKVADFPAAVVAVQPGIFTVAGGTGQAAATNEDGSINTESNPAERGSIISLYATGEGSDVNVISLKIGGYAAELLYAGPAPGFPGLMQVNARVPAGFLPPGNQPVVLWVGTVATQDGVTIAVR